MSHITWFDAYAPGDEPQLGGKNASLGVMTAAGLPVPPGFAITCAAYRELLASNGLAESLTEVLADVVPDSPATVSAAGTVARALVMEAQLPAGLDDEIRAAYAELSQRCVRADVPVAVRSSATCEDSPDASFAGEHDTYLWIRSADAVVEHVRRCWASLFTDRAIAYRRALGYADDGIAMSVGVQKMVLPRTSGVAFTLNPHNGDRSQVAIDASWGFGEAVVSGSVTPDNFLVDKVLGTVTRRTISSKTVEHTLGDDDAVVEVDVDETRRDEPCLSDEEIAAVARLARKSEKHYGCPQDVEWAIDADLPAPDNVLLLQSRPETVWSRKSPGPSRRGDEGYLDSIVHTLMDPLHGRASQQVR
ncbi:MAG: PEP/pyruvate-binding domain-containing protein [Mycetocola sp.]